MLTNRCSFFLLRVLARLLAVVLPLGLTTLAFAPAPALAAVPTSTTVNNPPAAGLNVIVFPQRDFISASGYHSGDTVQVSVIHPSGVTYSTNDVTPQADPRAAVGAPFAGIVEE